MEVGQGRVVPVARAVLVRVAATAVVLGLAFLAAAALPDRGPLPGLLDVPWWVLAVAVAVCEWGPVPLPRSGTRRRVDVGAVPLTVGLLVVAPVPLVGAVLLGAGLVPLIRRGRSPASLVDAVVVAAVQVTVALGVVRLVWVGLLQDGLAISAGTAGADGLTRTVCGAVVVLAVVLGYAAGAPAGRLLAVAVGEAPGPRSLRWWPGAATLLVPAVLAAATATVVLAVRYAETGLPLVVTGSALLVGYRAHAALVVRQSALERLHLVSDSLAHSVGTTPGAAATDLTAPVHAVLRQAQDLFAVDHVEVVWPRDGEDCGAWTLRGDLALPPAAAPSYRRSLGVDAEGTVPVPARVVADAEALRHRGVRAAMVAPLAAGPVGGHLLVGDATVSGRSFTATDLRMLVTLANQGAAALTNASLIQRLYRESRSDELTGLPNRARFRELIEERCAAPDPFAVMLLDFDGFKAINDTLGHVAGDELLRAIAGRLARTASGAAEVARLGGDEFAVIVAGCSSSVESQLLARRLLGVFDAPVQLDQARLRLSGSLGIAHYPDHGENATELMRRADAAMYAAKAGAGGARLFTEDLLDGDALALTLGGDLRDALDRDEVDVVVHPVVRLGSEELHSVEVLARWNHPELGAVEPATFFAAAEQAGLVPELSVRILHRALRLCRGWLDQGSRVRVAVNVAPRWLADTALPEMVGAALAAHGVPAELLTLELTERGVIADPQRVTRTLHRLHEAGVRLSVDDFGTGYSSLSYLSRLPVDQVKIDKLFVGGIIDNERDLAIVKSLVDLGRHLRLEVVAEGVSSAAVRDTLERVGCTLGQGYLFARPFAPEELDDFVTGRRPLGLVG